MPVGGYKHSGIGRENGVMTLQSYTQVKSIQVEMGKFSPYFNRGEVFFCNLTTSLLVLAPPATFWQHD